MRLRGRPAVQARHHQAFPERLHALRGRRRDAHLGRQRGFAGLDAHQGQLRVRGEKTKRARAARRVAVRAVEVPRHDVATGRRLVHGHDASDRTQGTAGHAARACRLGEKPSLFVRTGRPRAAGSALVAGNVAVVVVVVVFVVVFERVHAQIAHPTTQRVASAVLPSGSRGARPRADEIRVREVSRRRRRLRGAYRANHHAVEHDAQMFRGRGHAAQTPPGAEEHTGGGECFQDGRERGRRRGARVSAGDIHARDVDVARRGEVVEQPARASVRRVHRAQEAPALGQELAHGGCS
mmetsp:Transcript_7087/g.29250  ORF Transcript_7087/g.29250 Transcript_7087/m.29250 type:complete len:295 (-) Transcript_7087:1772-2656(-)